VQAALAALHQGKQERERISLLLDRITPGLESVDANLPDEARMRDAVEANVRWSMRQILETPEGQARQAEGLLKLVGAVYELDTGRVRFLE